MRIAYQLEPGNVDCIPVAFIRRLNVPIPTDGCRSSSAERPINQRLILSAYSRHAVKVHVLRRGLFLAENVSRFRPELLSLVY